MDEALTKPRNVTHTLYKLYNWLQMGMIDLNPEFQRGEQKDDGLTGCRARVL
jgi:hypothetical protein